MRIELLPNGYYRIFDYGTKWSGLYHMDGTYHAGDLKLSFWVVIKLIKSL